MASAFGSADDDVPLLRENSDDDVENISDKDKDYQGRFKLTLISNVNKHGSLLSDNSPTINYPADSLFAIFIVGFDVGHGNIIEWQMPEIFPLKDVEFKALPSGSHNLIQDCVYFRHKSLYGLSCIENIRDSTETNERGMRIKSVGILSNSYIGNQYHLNFLQTQVSHHVHHPGNYEALLEFFHDKQSSINGLQEPDLTSLYFTQPEGDFVSFVEEFGPKIFPLWRIILLNKRILFYSSKELSTLCYKVYFSCLLSYCLFDFCLNDQKMKTLFYVNVKDTEILKNEHQYIACTTEKVLQNKINLFDVFIDVDSNNLFYIHNNNLTNIVKVTSSDQEKYKDLFAERLRYFIDFSSKLFGMLSNLSKSYSKQVTRKDIHSIGLRAKDDKLFLLEVIETYGFNLVIVVNNPCCPFI
ncbi:unnamed protein product [Didymodactylos carnosus]|uniref:DENN domain-containing protein 11 n=1 Tax=Didymodactylos carnosus TaxID=1234261 RepID=A0A815F8D3_9BILA|nr:unnamed protein product [Didymodactylos carnosus]CAF1325677.1 unnamed protein product [Didymodactylos carnosus]CAF3828300.1 unnamed protein product [Didymodactylos carnosus]CAF4175196.1 unnamed protein product [Didymodactylos carnosus]